MLPAIAHVHIKIDGDYQAAVIVVHAAPTRRPLHLRDDLASRPPTQVPYARDLDAITQVVEDVNERVIIRDRDDGPAWQHPLNGCLKYGPLILAVAVIDQQKP